MEIVAYTVRFTQSDRFASLLEALKPDRVTASTARFHSRFQYFLGTDMFCPPRDVRCELIRYPARMTTDRVVRDFGRTSRHPGEIVHLLKLGQHPELATLPRPFRIIAPGSDWKISGGHHHFPCLIGIGTGELMLDTECDDPADGWQADDFFLAAGG